MRERHRFEFLHRRLERAHRQEASGMSETHEERGPPPETDPVDAERSGGASNLGAHLGKELFYDEHAEGSRGLEVIALSTQDIGHPRTDYDKPAKRPIRER